MKLHSTVWLIRKAITIGLVLSIAAGVVGQVLRDRSVVLALLMYLPLLPLGLAAVGWDAIRRGRGLLGPRFGLGGLGLATVIGSTWPMIGSGPGTSHGPEISVLHWNVIWGGGQGLSPGRRASIRREILDREADLIVLSEAPPDDWLDGLVASMGPGASRVQVQHGPRDSYWYKLVVCSKGPLRLVRRESIADGAGMVVEAEVRGRVVRLLVVDAKSNPLLSRTPRLLDIARACRRAREAGEPIDVVAGDFNSVGRSLGFDAIEAEGYVLASRASRGWRGTFPSPMPVFDIDHVWVRRELPGLRDELFTNFASDHRGQVVRFGIPD
ncbi:endonuclease/exonuclease/phosphatase family protein [Tundrisphaera lichenicola]|uniref:endonuclease/exonuclease/phosphatase family protein n=1 Tax=Tundrisphaera lichenicola TaxID=2029860 RepID=UPI003EBDCBB2